MYDSNRLIAAVLERNRIRLEADDPAFVIVTLCESMLDEIGNGIESQIAARTAVLEATIANLEKRTGTLIGSEAKSAAAQIRDEIQKDIEQARIQAAHLVYMVNQAHSRPARLRSFALALLAAVVLSGASFWLGFFVKAH